ncbi:Uncharacterised protein [Mycobacteroides abscessus subsp. massiliense]|nr:Uncharacterised protein [Mycobacteroides abscessus subsp. massiliense]
MAHAVGLIRPEATRNLLSATDDKLLVLIAIRHHHPEDLQHRVGEIRIPAPGTEPDLAKNLTMVERQLRECF